MSDLKLFKLSSDHVTELAVSSMALEKSLQTLIEKHLDTFLGVTFLASEYSTGPKTGGRMHSSRYFLLSPRSSMTVQFGIRNSSFTISPTRDVTTIGHFGTGNLELTLTSKADIEKARHLIELSYEAN